MNNTSESILSKKLKCLSCSTRREILLLIKRNAMPIRDIATSIGMTQNTVKRHIEILNDCELLSLNKRGNTIIYSANIESLCDTIDTLSSIYRETN